MRAAGQARILTLDRNFLHSAALELNHPKTGDTMRFSSLLPAELEAFLADLGQSA
jgi:23S rRNA-/tRNA-specific pseudouridylate synthase